MQRVEIISNKSVEDDVTQALEEYVPDIYTRSFRLFMAAEEMTVSLEIQLGLRKILCL
ncbi:MAG: hypothetical protein L6V90_13375 [Treponema succinifaciens]|nr:MAG: hypothetical protein L6V90_13375 [Treponema succinifaciens]